MACLVYRTRLSANNIVWFAARNHTVRRRVLQWRANSKPSRGTNSFREKCRTDSFCFTLCRMTSFAKPKKLYWMAMLIHSRMLEPKYFIILELYKKYRYWRYLQLFNFEFFSLRSLRCSKKLIKFSAEY